MIVTFEAASNDDACGLARACLAGMSSTSHTGHGTGRKLDSGNQSALEKLKTIKRARADGSAVDNVEIETAKEIYEEVSDDEWERRQRKAHREGFVEEDGGELVADIPTALHQLIPQCRLNSECRNWRLRQQRIPCRR
jgi:hypothetical protein